jgi:mRNA interferase RelE/StbE
MERTIILSTRAAAQLDALHPTAETAILDKLTVYALNPAALGNQVTRLKGSGFLRLRVGNYRVIFTDDGVVLDVIEIGHRREVYR